MPIHGTRRFPIVFGLTALLCGALAGLAEDWNPVPMLLDGQASVTVGAQANAGGPAIGNTSDTQSGGGSVTENSYYCQLVYAFTSASGDTMGDIGGGDPFGDPFGPPVYTTAGTLITSTEASIVVRGDFNIGQYASISINLDMMHQTTGYDLPPYGLQASSSVSPATFTGQLAIGTAPAFPAGSHLMLNFELNGAGTWSSDSQAGAEDIFISVDNGVVHTVTPGVSASIPVVAGQTVDVSFRYDGEHYNFYPHNGTESLNNNFSVSFNLLGTPWDFGAGASYEGYTATGSGGTTATLQGGEAGGDRDLSMTFSAGAATNGATLVGEVLTFTGAGSDLYVLAMTYDEGDLGGLAEEDLRLLWDAGDGEFVNAVLGNSNAAEVGESLFWAGSFASSPGTLGCYGVDTASNTVWAVLDHNSDFAAGAVPEPCTLGLLALGGLGLLRRRR